MRTLTWLTKLPFTSHRLKRVDLIRFWISFISYLQLRDASEGHRAAVNDDICAVDVPPGITTQHDQRSS
jgi:hypothetical protein